MSGRRLECPSRSLWAAHQGTARAARSQTRRLEPPLSLHLAPDGPVPEDFAGSRESPFFTPSSLRRLPPQEERCGPPGWVVSSFRCRSSTSVWHCLSSELLDQVLDPLALGQLGIELSGAAERGDGVVLSTELGICHAQVIPDRAVVGGLLGGARQRLLR